MKLTSTFVSTSARTKSLLTAFVLCATTGGFADSLKLPAIFSDHMVLQRDQKIPVWGKADKGTEVTVKLADKTASATTGADGTWKVELEPLSAGGPYTLEVNGDGNKTFKDVLIGEVWVCSGQSNMDWVLGKFKQSEKDVKNAANENIRLLKIPRHVAYEPQDDAASDGWKVSSPESAEQFSAVGYYFGRDIQKELDVPVGLIHTAYGGTPVEAWSTTDAVSHLPFMKEEVEAAKKRGDHKQLIAEFSNIAKARQKKILADDIGRKENWHEENISDADWQNIKLPATIEDGIAAMDGVIWFRKTVELPETITDKDTGKISLGPLDDEDFTYINGKQVGALKQALTERVYDIPAGILKPGKNVISIRLYDKGGAGGFRAKKANLLKLTVAGKANIPLAGDWKYKIGSDSRQAPQLPQNPSAPNQLAVLYNGMINPIVPYGMRGVIWYQGENNANKNPEKYKDLFSAMITDWRKNWGQGDFPFLFVQLAAYAAPKGGDGWALLRDAQTETLELPNTGMAVALDVGEEKDIHPWQKQPVGERLALAAKKIAYGKDVVYEGPMVDKAGIRKGEGESVVVPFNKAKKLKINSNANTRSMHVVGFEVAGSDGVWHEAKGVIKNGDSTEVIVGTDKVKEPQKVRYGWKSWVVVNLYNEADLPAVPFTAEVKQ